MDRGTHCNTTVFLLIVLVIGDCRSPIAARRLLLYSPIDGHRPSLFGRASIVETQIRLGGTRAWYLART